MKAPVLHDNVELVTLPRRAFGRLDGPALRVLATFAAETGPSGRVPDVLIRSALTLEREGFEQLVERELIEWDRDPDLGGWYLCWTPPTIARPAPPAEDGPERRSVEPSPFLCAVDPRTKGPTVACPTPCPCETPCLPSPAGEAAHG